MRKKILSVCFSVLFLVPFVVMAVPCDLTPKKGKIYEAGWCYDEFNKCYKLFDFMDEGDCYIEIVLE